MFLRDPEGGVESLALCLIFVQGGQTGAQQPPSVPGAARRLPANRTRRLARFRAHGSADHLHGRYDLFRSGGATGFQGLIDEASLRPDKADRSVIVKFSGMFDALN